MATFDSKQYGWCKLTVAFGGRIIDGITEVEYTEKQEKDYLFGRGCSPHGVLRGHRTYEGKLSLWQSELEAMTRDAPDKDVMKLNFDIIIAYVPDDAEGQVVTDILKGCEFSEVKKSMKQGDKNMIVELPIMITKILRQQ
ncbi:hypothetical protein [Riemerella columbipharyngis]|uniref:Uncharacterized protein n=1 Tax=Riemerella columbipharyngis TaxID=1071918 RepID=A0A1G7FM79_9FLAO|nr:hypothetical protein [Riemerella columbipharyngis]SDE76966.1 hypothetical protein SAMN05421544_12417 [Riemerella columbipharyngis]